MTKSKKVFLSVFALVIVGLSAAVIIGLARVRERYGTHDKVNSIIFDLPIEGIGFDQDGSMWVSDGVYLSVYENGELVKEFPKHRYDIRSTGPDIIDFDNEGRTWVASPDQGVLVLNERKLIWIYNTNSDFGRKGSITAFAVDPDGNGWVGIYDEGIIVIDRTGKILNNYNVSNSGLEHNTIEDIAFDDQGIAWISTFRTRMGLNSFNGNEWKTYDFPGGQITFDQQGRIWVGSQWGIGVFDGLNWTRYDLGTSQSFDIVEDRSGRIWVLGGGESCGLCMFDGKVWKYYYPKNQDDPVFSSPYSSFLPNMLVSDDDGNLWFVTQSIEAWQISNNLPLFTLAEVNFLLASDKGIFLSLFIFLVSLWLVFAAPSWRNMAIGIVAGETIYYFVSIALLNLEVLYFSPIGAINVVTRGVLSGVLGWLIGSRTGVARRRLIVGLVVAVAIVSSIVFWISILPQ